MYLYINYTYLKLGSGQQGVPEAALWPWSVASLCTAEPPGSERAAGGLGSGTGGLTTAFCTGPPVGYNVTQVINDCLDFQSNLFRLCHECV